MTWRPQPQRVAPAPWFKTITDLFRAPDVVTPTGVGMTIVEAVHELSEAVRELAQVVRDANDANRRPDDDP